MREVGWAMENRKDGAAAAARLVKRSTAPLEGVGTFIAKDQTMVAAEKVLERKILPGDYGKIGKPLLSELPKQVLADPVGRPHASSADAEAIGSSPSRLIEETLQDPRHTRDELLDCLTLVPQMHLEAVIKEVRLVQAARDARLSWAEIAEAQKLSSRQVAEHRYKRLLESVSPLLTEHAQNHRPDATE